MAKTRKSFTGDGGTTLYTFEFEYLKKVFVKVYFDDSETTEFTLSGDHQVTLNNAPEAGTKIDIRRETASNRLVTFVDGSVLLAKDMNISDLQAIHIAEEANDTASLSSSEAAASAVLAANSANDAATSLTDCVTAAGKSSYQADRSIAAAQRSEELSNRIETFEPTGENILTELQDVDGHGSGLDADKLDGQHASSFARLGENATFRGMVQVLREGHEHVRLGGREGMNAFISYRGSEGLRAVTQGYAGHFRQRVYKTDGGYVDFSMFADGRIRWNGKNLLTEEDKEPDRRDDFSPFPVRRSLTSVLHGYGKVPSRVEAWAVCVNDTSHFTTGDRVLLSSNYRYHTGATAIGCSETEVFFATRSTEFANKQANGNVVVNGSTNWKLEILSWM